MSNETPIHSAETPIDLFPGIAVGGSWKISFVYKNWQGKIAERKVHALRIWWGQTEYHPTNQWFLRAIDLEKNEKRDFAMADMSEVRIEVG